MFLLSTRNFPPDIGGIQSLMEGLAKALVNHGPVKVFADNHGDAEKYDDKSLLNIQRIGGLKIFKKYRKANLISEFIENNSVRAIFFDHWKSLENINEDIVKKIPSFCLIHSKEINHPLGSNLNKRMIKSLSKVKNIVANSHFTKELILQFGTINKNITVINPGCDYPLSINQEFKEKAKKIFGDSFPKIITIARLDKRKSHQNILMTIKNLKQKYPKIKYVCIGDGDEKKNIEDLKRELGLSENVIILNKTNEQLKVSLLNESHLFLMPSIIYKKSVEGFGITFIEAASYGVGSIGGKEGGEKDAIIDKETGYICDGNDLNSIYENVINFFENENYKQLGKNAQKFSEKFKWDKIIKQYLNLI